MATSFRLNGNRDLAAQYWGEAKRVLFQLNQVLETGGIDTGAKHLTYPDGTTISVKSFFGNAVIEITSPFVRPREEGKKSRGDVIVFYYKDGTPRVLITDTSILGVTEEGYTSESNDFSAEELGFPVSTQNYPIIAKKFDNYQGAGSAQNRGPVWFIRMPFIFSGSSSEGKYFFEGFSYGAYRDYLYEENTGAFYLIQTGSAAGDPFNIGNYIYVLNSAAGKLRAYSFNFDTKAVTLEKEVTTYIAADIGFVDAVGNFYYRDTGWKLYGDLSDDYISQQGYADLNVGSLMTGVGDMPIYLGEEGSYPSGTIGHWPGGAITPFIESDGPPPNGNYSQHQKTIYLYEILKVNIWTEAVSTHLSKAYSHTPYTYDSSKTLRTLGYTTHDKCFTKLAGENLDCGALTLISNLDCGLPIHRTTSESNPPISIVNKEYNWEGVEVIQLLGKSYTCPLSFEGESQETYNGSTLTAYTLLGVGQATQIDLTPGILPFPYGAGTPFHVFQKRTRQGTVTDTASLGSGTRSYNSLQDVTERSFISPFDSVNLESEESVSGWMHLQGNGVLTQGVIGSGSMGKRIYNVGASQADMIASYLDIPRSQIQGIIYLPMVDENDPFYQEKVLQNP